jgi:hypothetical protein
MQHRVLEALRDAGEPREIRALADALGIDQAQIAAAGTTLAEQGLVRVDEREFDEFRLGPDGEPYINGPLPERVIAAVLAAQGGSCGIKQVPEHCDLDAGQVGQSLRWLAQRGWAKKQGDQLVLSADAKAKLEGPQPDEIMIRALTGVRTATADELEADNGLSRQTPRLPGAQDAHEPPRRPDRCRSRPAGQGHYVAPSGHAAHAGNAGGGDVARRGPAGV